MPDVLIYLCVLVLCTAVIAIVGVVSCAVACFLQWLADKVVEGMSKVDKQVLQMLMDYHAFRGDTKVRFVRCLHTPRGGELYLMRFNNKQGARYSSVDAIWHDFHGAQYASELFSEVRSEEAEMIRFVMEEDDAPSD